MILKNIFNDIFINNKVFIFYIIGLGLIFPIPLYFLSKQPINLEQHFLFSLFYFKMLIPFLIVCILFIIIKNIAFSFTNSTIKATGISLFPIILFMIYVAASFLDNLEFKNKANGYINTQNNMHTKNLAMCNTNILEPYIVKGDNIIVRCGYEYLFFNREHKLNKSILNKEYGNH